MLISGEVEWSAGGYPSPTYSGAETVHANVDQSADLEEMESTLKSRAFTKLKRDYCGLGVTIHNVKVTRYHD